MSKKEQITYQTVAGAAQELRGQGIPPTVRAVRQAIGGGSNSTILEYMRRWEADVALSATVTEGLSDTFLESIKAEFGRMMQGTREKLETQLAKEKQQTKEANELLAETENKLAELETQREAEKTQAAETILKLEKQLAAANERNVESQKQIEKLELQWKEAVTGQEAARLEAAKAQLQIERADKVANEVKEQIAALQTKIEKLQQEKEDAKISAAVAEERLAHKKNPSG